MKIGCVNSENTILKGGPKSFMNRLKEKLIENDLYTADFDKMDAYIGLSFIKLPKKVINNKNIQVITRFDGIRNWTLLPPIRIFNFLRNFQLYFLNKTILFNIKNSDKLLFQSDFSKKQNEYLTKINKINISDKISRIIYNGVEMNNKKTIDNVVINEPFPKIIVLHRFHPMKRAIQIPNILVKLKKQYPNFRAYFIGSGVFNPYSPWKNSLNKIKSYVKKLNLLDNIKFLGHLEHKEMKKIIKNSHFMLNLSFSDPCPNSVIEAQSYGLPVIAPNSGGIPEIVPDKSLLVDEKILINKLWPIYFDNYLPKILVNSYLEKIEFLIKNLNKYRRITLKYSVDKRNLNDVVQKYVDFIKE